MQICELAVRTRARGRYGWPPNWISGYNGAGRQTVGEIGTLTRVSRLGRGLFLTMTIEGREYYGSLEWDPPPAVILVERVLLAHLGRSIREIGRLDIDEAER